jgi:ferredoxin
MGHPGEQRSRGLLHVWIDQDLCTGDGLCTDHCPAVFTILEDGIAYVKQDGIVLNDPGGSRSLALVPPRFEQVVVESSEECPGECIFVEYQDEHLDVVGSLGPGARGAVG